MPIDSESQSELKSALRTLSAEQIRFVAARMYANSDEEAYRNAGVPRGAMSRWPNRSIVEEAIRLASGNVIPLAVEALQRHVMPAVETLGEAVIDKKAHWRDRIVAASSVLDRTGIPKTKEIHGTMETRVTYRLEDILAAQAMAAEVEAMGGQVERKTPLLPCDLAVVEDNDLVTIDSEDGDGEWDWADIQDEELPFSEPPESEE